MLLDPDPAATVLLARMALSAHSTAGGIFLPQGRSLALFPSGCKRRRMSDRVPIGGRAAIINCN
jgi:hypothetical protein